MRINFKKNLLWAFIFCLTILSCKKEKGIISNSLKNDTIKTEETKLNKQDSLVEFINTRYNSNSKRNIPPVKLPDKTAEEYTKAFQLYFKLPKYPTIFPITFNIYKEIIAKNGNLKYINFQFIENNGNLDLIYLDENKNAYLFSHDGTKLHLITNLMFYIDNFNEGVYENMNDVIKGISNKFQEENTIKIRIPINDFNVCKPLNDKQAIFLSPGISVEEKIENENGILIINKNRYFITLILQSVEYIKDTSKGFEYEINKVNGSYDRFCLTPPGC